jgi:beta-barrel assembly-enhancing protease
MKSWFASWTELPSTETVEATVLASEQKLTVGLRKDGTIVTFHWNTRDIAAVYDMSLQATRITNRNEKGKLMVEGKEAAEYIQAIQEEQSKPWFQKKHTREWTRNTLIAISVLGVLIAVYFLLVPWLAGKMAGTISTAREQQLGDAAYNAMDIASQQDPRLSAVANEFFSELKITTPYNIRITVVKGDVVNAFALPGGHIVVYTALLDEIESYPELAALFAHEFTHVNNRHATKSIFRQLGSRIFINLLLGRFGSVSSTIVNQADRLKSLNYSRKLEKEADLEGLALLKNRNIDPAGFSQLFAHLRAAGPPESMPELIASHPDIESRLQYVKEASANAVIEENSTLKELFNKLKSIEP